MGKRKKTSFFLALGSVVLVLVLLGWFLCVIFEGEKPGIALRPLPDFLSGSQEFGLTISDTKRGLRILEVSLKGLTGTVHGFQLIPANIIWRKDALTWKFVLGIIPGGAAEMETCL